MRRSDGGLNALSHKLIEGRKRHPGLALPAFWFAQASAVLFFRYGWNESPVGVYGLEGTFFGGDVVSERPHHGAARHGQRLLTAGEPGSIGAGYVAHRCALDVALDTSELAREEEGSFAKRFSYLHGGVKHVIGGQVRVAVHDAHAGEVGVLEAWDGPEYAPLLAPLQARLEADDVVEATLGVVLPQLHDGVGDLAGSGIREADGLHGPEAEGVLSAPGDGLDRETALEVQILLEVLYGAEFGGSQVLYKGIVLLFGHRAVQVCSLTLAVAGGAVDDGVVQRVAVDYGRGRVVEVERLPGKALYLLCQSVRGQGACRYHGRTPRYVRDLLADHLYIRVGLDRLGNGAWKVLAGDPEGATRRNRVDVGAA